MTEHATPTPLRGLQLLPGGSVTPATVSPDTDTVLDPGVAPVSPVPVSATVSLPVSPATGVVPMTVPERARVAVRYWTRETALELWLHPDRLLHVLYHGRPGSAAELLARVKSRQWVPGELEGTKRGKALAFAGVAFYVLVAPLKAAFKTADAATDNPLRLIGVAAFVIVLFFIVF